MFLEEHRKKLSFSLKGKNTWSKGSVLSDEHKRKISIANKGKTRSEEVKKKFSELRKLRPNRYWKGKKLSEETKRKMSEARKGKKLSPETIKKLLGRTPWNKGAKGVFKPSDEWRKKQSEARQGNKNYFFGKHHSEETKLKLRLASMAKTGELASNWQGGKSFEPYSTDWTKTLRQSIRERDQYTCKICGGKQGDVAFSVHHIDYNKLNCNPDNLITLCVRCHTKTNGNREYWINYLNTLMNS